ncbi:drug resistance MFS transporter, drug:H+ antiporter-2 (14 Spanner) (DHA2) family [Chromobacterium violaceum]|uniref:Drug resistance MFS transporter, drug:H+ antiporter-2 (14 Spanner) (DHA2) family n=1 Tax=Chromobacterium violaceum TaxID=536 RepID=A0A3S4HLK3_CHRVL|nr:drug resistance MFS transporter, drug:H+ antiporter-2 (14 Spanner) (DHA2) family [Chromobacterium violaceum]
MMLGGLGLGLLMPNLTIFVQQLAPRQQLGVSTAMLQSTRMVGGMLGTAVMGAVVSHHFQQGVAAMLSSRHGEAWLSRLADPQTLLNADSLAQFRRMAASAGADGLLAASREALVASIHYSQWLVAAALLLGLWLVRKVPVVRLDSAVPEQELRHE